MIHDHVIVTGKLKVQLFDRHGCLKEERVMKNVVTTVGKTHIATMMTGGGTAMTHLAIGTGTNAAAVGDTALQTEAARSALSSLTSAAAVATYAASFGAGTGTGAITEAGIFSAGAGGNMLARTVFSVINKGASDVLTVSWAITVG